MKQKVSRRGIHIVDESPAASLDELRAAIVMLHAELDASDVSEPTGPGFRDRLREITAELDGAHPEGATVRARWNQVRELLEPARHRAHIVQITGLIAAVFDIPSSFIPTSTSADAPPRSDTL
ncbi:MAG TPA: hypothetical protein VGJ13_16460 [Pseudonocardiaceae bacterium]|jgi:hypothetical protein